LTKSEIFPICFCCRNLFPLGPGEDSLSLFETSGPQPLRELKGGGEFLIFLARNPLKSLDSEK
jgi:hypothetical protein